MIVGESALEVTSPATLHTFTTRVPVSTGDIIGLYLATTGGCFGQAPGWAASNNTGDTPPGSTVTFFPPNADVRYDVSAQLEPDADGDGFGDETQDQCPTSASTQADCSPPDTTITKGPKKKTKKKQASFEFTSSETGSSFECAFDLQSFSSCTSPLTQKAKKGKHSFRVRAEDAAGNVDPTPASFDWKVRKKKKK